MAAAGASLGFGVQKLDGQIPSHPLYVGLAAMALWILSFMFGCMVVTGTQKLVAINMDLINRMDEGRHRAAEAANQRSKVQFDRVRRRQVYQFSALALGVVLFAAWRVLLIFQPPYASSCIP
jgi:hypothetical protein